MRTKPIKETFTRGGFDYQQIWRSRMVAIYAQRRTSKPDKIAAYEVVRLRQSDPHPLAKQGQWDQVEVYPSPEKWGLEGFTCQTLDRAYKRANLMLAERQGATFNTQTISG